ncbi:MAG: oxygen-dependent coproporphyrinogen oxidase [Cytophagaceae bacterium]|nr:oxygen-dependent coproporphyrinogen oxidase [Cytophagaceae bacterium]MDW8455265.1 oxygen-dependent coproporphyrinogen oxidase [Cytophagaceae bacterium]
MTVNKNEIEEWFKTLQTNICNALTNFDTKVEIVQDVWQREQGGGGCSNALRNGRYIEKGGVNFSAVHGEMPEKILKALQLPPAEFYATGISIVLHPLNPHCPIIHMNTRYFEMSDGHWWFGGGIDLTPHYIEKEEARLFHSALKQVCDAHDSSYYNSFKKWADDYFFLAHRNETRGVGGIFFDRLTADEKHNKLQLFHFVKDVGNIFAPTYIQLMNRKKDMPYNENHLNWQLLRRSRYVEFNLIYDKGTKFGLDTNGRTESILMSMPPMARWEYNYVPQEESPEQQTLNLLAKNIDWI